MNNDEKILSEVCQAIASLKRADVFGKLTFSRFDALDRHIEELEEWASLWASESEDEDACVKILDNFKIEHRPYA